MALAMHRFAGLGLAIFLTVAGLTGTLLVFYDELDTALSPALRQVAPPYADAELLDGFELQQRVQRQLPAEASSWTVPFDLRRNAAARVWVEEAPQQWREVFVDPYDGRVLGSREWGRFTGELSTLMPFVYRLHYCLGLGEVGRILFGVVALLWTLDCFVGAYLTFPLPEGRRRVRKRWWFRRWLPAWFLKTKRLFSFVFTWHRASGLWLWALLLVFAWSAVGLNLREVYQPVMRALAGLKPSPHDTLPDLPPPHPDPGLSLREAHQRGRELMAEQAAQRGFVVERELSLSYAADHGAFVYRVESSLDVSAKYPGTEVYFDGHNGHLIGFDAPRGIAPGNTITSWLYALHFASVGGTAYRILVLFVGLAVAALSVTGVWIWARKLVRRSQRLRPASLGSQVLGQPQLQEPALLGHEQSREISAQ
jgi:uncharacterized iron-regulated membrane protein